MKRFVASLFLLLYLYNSAGYLAVFSYLQYRVRSEVKQMLKASVPRSELVLFAFHTRSLESNIYAIHWIEDHEFRYQGGMYDIVNSSCVGDTTYLLCLNDIMEEELFKDLGNHVQRHMGYSEKQGMLDSLRDVFKQSYFTCIDLFDDLLAIGLSVAPQEDIYKSVVMDIPSPPPRTFAVSSVS